MAKARYTPFTRPNIVEQESEMTYPMNVVKKSKRSKEKEHP